MRYIATKGLDRGGTNAFLSLFHYHPEFFSLSEKVHSQTGKKNIKKIPINKLFNYSMFKGLDKNLKDPSIIRNIIFKMPREAEFIGNIFRYRYHEYKYDKIIYLIRNPLRVYISQQNANKKRGKTRTSKWDYWHSILNQTSENIAIYKKSDKQNSRLLIYEYFIKNLDVELPKLLKWIDKDSKRIKVNPKMGLKFWRHCGICNSKLINFEYLICPKCKKKILGHGRFNPITPLRYKRTIQANLHTYFADKPKKINDVRQKFGEVLFNYWFNDKNHNYATILEIS